MVAYRHTCFSGSQMHRQTISVESNYATPSRDRGGSNCERFEEGAGRRGKGGAISRLQMETDGGC